MACITILGKGKGTCINNSSNYEIESKAPTSHHWKYFFISLLWLLENLILYFCEISVWLTVWDKTKHRCLWNILKICMQTIKSTEQVLGQNTFRASTNKKRDNVNKYNWTNYQLWLKTKQVFAIVKIYHFKIDDHQRNWPNSWSVENTDKSISMKIVRTSYESVFNLLLLFYQNYFIL